MPLTNFETSMVRPSRSLVTQTSNRDGPGRSSVDQPHISHASGDACWVHSAVEIRQRLLECQWSKTKVSRNHKG